MNIPEKMKAMVLEKKGERLKEKEVPVPRINSFQVLIKIKACGVCHTDLHIVDQELKNPRLPLIPGHEIVGTIVKKGEKVRKFKINDRVGVPWLGFTCGHCKYCSRGQENLCENALFTGYTLDGGYAEYTAAYQDYCFRIPEEYDDAEAAPLLCAGLIGYRTYRMAGEINEHLGIYGFGAAAHIVAQIAVHQGKKVYAFTRPGDIKAQDFARKLGAVWAGDSNQSPPNKLNAALIFAPVGALIPAALSESDKGAVIVSGGIHMSDIPSFAYNILWEERVIRSVANLTRQDGEEFLKIAPEVPVKTEISKLPLNQANKALDKLRAGEVEGAIVLTMTD
ncbi:MAG TPA: zinc-dependent alcohol dehydrogenase family protein [Ignavibacteriaceae bacterium]|nr:zinc-dependent alcohol dehydrogenase family protein [Ignavibacteriaceae bacterium]